ncbi:hypothetical protein BS78_07G016700 [Paspalum vaginatum]|nr:hypothetical protein BS78_07G016700 [Paspalum vaginatum]
MPCPSQRSVPPPGQPTPYRLRPPHPAAAPRRPARSPTAPSSSPCPIAPPPRPTRRRRVAFPVAPASSPPRPRIVRRAITQCRGTGTVQRSLGGHAPPVPATTTSPLLEHRAGAAYPADPARRLEAEASRPWRRGKRCRSPILIFMVMPPLLVAAAPTATGIGECRQQRRPAAIGCYDHHAPRDWVLGPTSGSSVAANSLGRTTMV